LGQRFSVDQAFIYIRISNIAKGANLSVAGNPPGCDHLFSFSP
jgi:hypothetical protein